MDPKKMTKIFIVGMIAAIAVFDSYVFIEGGTEATISYTIMQWSYDYPAFTFALGYVMGHLTWRIRLAPKKETGPKHQ